MTTRCDICGEPATCTGSTLVAGSVITTQPGPACDAHCEHACGCTPVIALRVETLEPTGKTLQIPEHLRWYPNEPNRGIGKRAVFLHAVPASEEEIAALIAAQEKNHE